MEGLRQTSGYWAANEKGPEARKAEGNKRKGVWLFRKEHKQRNSNLNLNSNNQKQCTSMNATINSYSSFILFQKKIKCLNEIKSNPMILRSMNKVF
jgi:hypothetical protein